MAPPGVPGAREARARKQAWAVLPYRRQDTFQRAKQWVKELQRQGNPNIVIALAGNKSDLNSKRKVEPEVRRRRRRKLSRE